MTQDFSFFRTNCFPMNCKAHWKTALGPKDVILVSAAVLSSRKRLWMKAGFYHQLVGKSFDHARHCCIIFSRTNKTSSSEKNDIA